MSLGLWSIIYRYLRLHLLLLCQVAPRRAAQGHSYSWCPKSRHYPQVLARAAPCTVLYVRDAFALKMASNCMQACRALLRRRTLERIPIYVTVRGTLTTRSSNHKGTVFWSVYRSPILLCKPSPNRLASFLCSKRLGICAVSSCFSSGL